MSGEIMLTIGDDGEATLYDDTYDITIHCESKEEQDEVRKALGNIPHWIPVTKRPDKSGDYLATLIDGAEKWVEIIYWNETFGGSWQAVIGDEEYYSTIGNVIAWMPLPEEYRGE